MNPVDIDQVIGKTVERIDYHLDDDGDAMVGGLWFTDGSYLEVSDYINTDGMVWMEYSLGPHVLDENYPDAPQPKGGDHE